MNKIFKKFIVMGIIASSISILPLTGASAEWKQDSKGWWNTEGSSWSVGWKQIDSKWYYFGQDGYMAHDTIVDGYKIDNNGVWIQNNTVNNTTETSTNVSNTANSNNSSNTNLTNNIDNSTSSNSSVTLNNTGVINANTTNNVAVDNTSKEEKDYYKELKKSQQNAQDDLKAYYQKQLNQAKDDLAEAKKGLDNVKSQLTIKTLAKQSDGTWQYVPSVDTSKVAQYEKKVKTYQDLVDYYGKLVK